MGLVFCCVSEKANTGKKKLKKRALEEDDYKPNHSGKKGDMGERVKVNFT